MAASARMSIGIGEVLMDSFRSIRDEVHNRELKAGSDGICHHRPGFISSISGPSAPSWVRQLHPGSVSSAPGPLESFRWRLKIFRPSEPAGHGYIRGGCKIAQNLRCTVENVRN